MRSASAATALLALAVAGAAAWVIGSQRSGSSRPVTYGDTGDCIGKWSQPSNAAAQSIAARMTASAGDRLALVGIDAPRGRCRIAVAASSAPDAIAHLFEAPAGEHVYRQLDRPDRPLRVAGLPASLRRWVSRVNGDGTLVGHP